MTYFVGNKGNIRIRRGASSSTTCTATGEDVSTALNRLGVVGASDNYLTGDLVLLETSSSSGLAFFQPASWLSGVIERDIAVYININSLDGVRFYPDFESAVNNTRANEYKLQSLAGEVVFTISAKGALLNVLGDVTNYELNTDRGAIEVSSLSDKFRIQYDAGLISGSGKINALFNYKVMGLTEPSILLLQVIQRVDVGSSVECAFYVIDKDLSTTQESVYYDLTAVITSAGVEVSADDIIRVSADFVTTGQVKLKVGTPAGFILTEDLDTIGIEQTLGSLLQEVGD